MHALELLTQRSSMPRLISPAPDEEALQLLEKAALRVPDHMSLTPYQAQILSGEQLTRLGQVFATAASQESHFQARDRERAAQLPVRAPMLIVVSTLYQDHPSVPRIEQYASAACATMAMQQACFALGYGAIWRSGPYAESAYVKQALHIDQADELVGFLYVGTPAVPTPIKPEKGQRLLKRSSL